MFPLWLRRNLWPKNWHGEHCSLSPHGDSYWNPLLGCFSERENWEHHSRNPPLVSSLYCFVILSWFNTFPELREKPRSTSFHCCLWLPLFHTQSLKRSQIHFPLSVNALSCSHGLLFNICHFTVMLFWFNAARHVWLQLPLSTFHFKKTIYCQTPTLDVTHPSRCESHCMVPWISFYT